MLTIYVLVYTQGDSTLVIALDREELLLPLLCGSVVQKLYPKKKINVIWLERKCF